MTKVQGAGPAGSSPDSAASMAKATRTIRIYLIFDSGGSEQNVEQLEGFASEQAAEARCEVLNQRDYGLDIDYAQDGDRWRWCQIDVEVDS